MHGVVTSNKEGNIGEIHAFIRKYNLQRIIRTFKGSLVVQMVKNLPAKQETQIRPLGREDPWRGDGSPLQYPCLENPMDRGAWWVQPMELQKVRHNCVANIHTHMHNLPSSDKMCLQ